MTFVEHRPTHPRSERLSEAPLWVLGEVISFHARLESFTLFESAQTLSGGLPPHSHHAQDESVYVLEGEYILILADEERRLEAGSFASIPRGTLHALRLSTGEAGRTLTLLNPPGDLERFIEEVGVPVSEERLPVTEPPAVEEVVSSARRHGTYLLTKPV